MMSRKNFVLYLLPLFAALAAFCGDTVRPGLERIEYEIPSQEEMALVDAIKEPFLAGKDVSAALQCWFDGRLLDKQKKADEAMRCWIAGMGKLKDLPALPPAEWASIPDATLKTLAELNMASHRGVEMQVVEWQSGKLTQYGAILFPRERKAGDRFPLILYCHGAAFGLPNDFMNWLAALVEKGYVVVAPAMRGEPLFQWQFPVNGRTLTCQGEIENLDGEVDDCLSMVAAAWKLPYVRKDEFAMIGHSFGAGVGLLAAARAGSKAKAVVSYDAWLVNPQRYYWDRMRRGARNWDSWEDYCNQPVAPQLAGLIKRSIVHNAARLECQMLLFMGGAYEGSVFHESHGDLKAELDRLGKQCRYEPIPDGDHNFVLRTKSKPAKIALDMQNAFLDKHYPPLGKK